MAHCTRARSRADSSAASGPGGEPRPSASARSLASPYSSERPLPRRFRYFSRLMQWFFAMRNSHVDSLESSRNLREVLVHADEDLLHQVVRLLPVPHHPHAEVVEPVLVRAHQRLEGLRLAPPQPREQQALLAQGGLGLGRDRRHWRPLDIHPEHPARWHRRPPTRPTPRDSILPRPAFPCSTASDSRATERFPAVSSGLLGRRCGWGSSRP